ncbi:unnamed protein product [Ceutorhynchus assimilis]|uniref:Uncharacterized protein n=1 Tax=Ceutorhynchus assimilis TaxID=467358 RepID=A0A9N9N1L6_9CUCU|nr:unnamed protein product [Ceutorhynchus assimilis]
MSFSSSSSSSSLSSSPPSSSRQTLDSLSSEAVKKTKIVSRLLKTQQDFKIHTRLLKKNIKLISSALKNKSSIHSYHKVESNLAILNYYLQMYKFNSKTNKSLNKRKLVWQDLDSCFNGRIKTGIINNLKFKEPQEFLKRTFRVFSLRIKKELKNSLLKLHSSCDIPNKRKFEELRKSIVTYHANKCFYNYQSQPWDEEGHMKMHEDMSKAENYDAATRKYWSRIQDETNYNKIYFNQYKNVQNTNKRFKNYSKNKLNDIEIVKQLTEEDIILLMQNILGDKIRLRRQIELLKQQLEKSVDLEVLEPDARPAPNVQNSMILPVILPQPSPSTSTQSTLTWDSNFIIASPASMVSSLSKKLNLKELFSRGDLIEVALMQKCKVKPLSNSDRDRISDIVISHCMNIEVSKDAKDSQIWLKNNPEMSSKTILQHWYQSYPVRKLNPHTPIEKYLEDWPILKVQITPKLTAVEQSQELVNNIFNVVMTEVSDLNKNDTQADDVLNNLNNIFKDKTFENLRLQFFENSSSFIRPEEVKIGTFTPLSNFSSTKPPDFDIKDAKYQKICIKQKFERFLELPNVYHTISQFIHEEMSSENIITSIYQGNLWKKLQVKFGKKNGFPLLLFFDDLETCSALGSRAGLYKVGTIYI